MAEIGWSDGRLEVGSRPIPGSLPSGPSLRYDPDFEAIETEVRRLESEGPNAVRWQQVAPASLAFLRDRSKDLLVAVYGGYALFRQEGIAGLAIGLGVIDGMIGAHWEGLTPPKARERARVAALEWLIGRLGPAIAEMAPAASEAAALEAALTSLTRIQEQLGKLLVREQVALGDLLRPLRRHVEALRQAEEDARRKEEDARRKSEADAAAAEARRVGAESAAREAARQAERAAAEAEAQRASRAEAVAEAARETEAAIATLAGPGEIAPGDPQAQLQAIGAGLLRVARSRLAAGEAGFETAVISAAAALLRLATLRRDAGARPLPDPDPAALSAIAQAGTDAERAEAALRLLGTAAPQALAAWHALDAATQTLTSGDPEAAQPIRAALRVVLAQLPDLPERLGPDGAPGLDAATRDWLAQQVTPPVAQASGALAEARQQAAAALAAGQAPRGFAILAAGLRQASLTRERFAWQLAQAELALAAGEAPLALPILRHLDEVAAQHRLDSWDPELAGAMLALTCRCLAATQPSPLMPAERRIAAYADAHGRLCRIDLVMAQSVRHEAPPPS